MQKSYKILLGVCVLCGVGYSLYYMYKAHGNLSLENQREIKTEPVITTTENEHENGHGHGHGHENEHGHGHEQPTKEITEEQFTTEELTTSMEKSTEKNEINAIIVFRKSETPEDLTDEEKQKRAETLKEDLKSKGFKNLQVLLSKNLSTTVTLEQLRQLQLTRDDLSVISK